MLRKVPQEHIDLLLFADAAVRPDRLPVIVGRFLKCPDWSEQSDRYMGQERNVRHAYIEATYGIYDHCSACLYATH